MEKLLNAKIYTWDILEPTDTEGAAIVIRVFETEEEAGREPRQYSIEAMQQARAMIDALDGTRQAIAYAGDEVIFSVRKEALEALKKTNGGE